MNKKLIGKYKKGNTILEVFDRNGVICARTSDVIDEFTQDVSSIEEFEDGATINDVLIAYSMEDAEKIS